MGILKYVFGTSSKKSTASTPQATQSYQQYNKKGRIALEKSLSSLPIAERKKVREHMKTKLTSGRQMYNKQILNEVHKEFGTGMRDKLKKIL